MSRPLVVDCFMYNNEAAILECRLTELYDAVDRFVLCDASVDHQDHPKPSFYLEERERFAPWADKIIHVFAEGLPTVQDDPDPWAREHAQREFFRVGLAKVDGLTADSVILQSDVDEIPTPIAARNVRPRGYVAFEQRLYCFAVDWQHPDVWCGTVAGRAGEIQSFGEMRDTRNITPTRLKNAGWHMSWLGGDEANLAKLNAFCHPEVADRIHRGLAAGNDFLRDGWHVDGSKMIPVDVDRTWPRYVAEGRCPKNWFRPR